MSDFSGGRADLVRSLNLLSAVLAGTYPDPADLHDLFWGYMGNALLQLVKDDFEAKAEGTAGLDGLKWPALAKATLLRKKEPPAPWHKSSILVETGALLESLEPGQGPNQSGAVRQVFDLLPDGVRVGTADPKADAHQSGDPYTNLPSRPIVPLDGNIPNGWEELLDRAIEVAMTAVIERMVGVGGIK